MPGGHPDRSLRSRPSSNDALTLIDSANAPSVRRRRSRCARNLGPNPGLDFNDILCTLRDKPTLADLTNIKSVQCAAPLHDYEECRCNCDEYSNESRGHRGELEDTRRHKFLATPRAPGGR